jgi:hypothetical protein
MSNIKKFTEALHEACTGNKLKIVQEGKGGFIKQAGKFLAKNPGVRKAATGAAIGAGVGAAHNVATGGNVVHGAVKGGTVGATIGGLAHVGTMGSPDSKKAKMKKKAFKAWKKGPDPQPMIS